MKKKLVTGTILTLLLSLSPACGDKEGGKPIIGGAAPDFHYTDIDGGKGSIRGLVGKVVLLRFWADWCPYCKYEMPRIDVFYRRLKDKGLEVLAVNVGQTRDVVDAFTAQLSLTHPMIMDPDGKLAESYGVKVIPTNFLIDRKGIIREILLGEIFIEDRVLANLLRPYFPEEGF